MAASSKPAHSKSCNARADFSPSWWRRNSDRKHYCHRPRRRMIQYLQSARRNAAHGDYWVPVGARHRAAKGRSRWRSMTARLIPPYRLERVFGSTSANLRQLSRERCVSLSPFQTPLTLFHTTQAPIAPEGRLWLGIEVAVTWQSFCRIRGPRVPRQAGCEPAKQKESRPWSHMATGQSMCLSDRMGVGVMVATSACAMHIADRGTGRAFTRRLTNYTLAFGMVRHRPNHRQ